MISMPSSSSSSASHAHLPDGLRPDGGSAGGRGDPSGHVRTRLPEAHDVAPGRFAVALAAPGRAQPVLLPPRATPGRPGADRRQRRHPRSGPRVSSPRNGPSSRSSGSIVRDGVAALPPKHQSVVVLYYLHGLSLQETAQILGVRLGTVKLRLHYALRGLRSHLEGDRRFGGAYRPVADEVEAPGA